MRSCRKHGGPAPVCFGTCPGSRGQRGSSSPPRPLPLGHVGAADRERGSAPARRLVAVAVLMWAVEGTVLELSSSCGRGRLLLWGGFVFLLGETCPSRALAFGSVCFSPSARVRAELLSWLLCLLYAPQIYGWPLLWAGWPRVTVPQPACGTQGWLRMEPWEPA